MFTTGNYIDHKLRELALKNKKLHKPETVQLKKLKPKTTHTFNYKQRPKVVYFKLNQLETVVLIA